MWSLPTLGGAGLPANKALQLTANSKVRSNHGSILAAQAPADALVVSAVGGS